MKTLEQAVYCDGRDSSHARYQKRCYLVRPQRRQVPLSETQQVVDLLNDYMTTMTALPDDKKTDAIGQDMYDVMRQYITETLTCTCAACWSCSCAAKLRKSARDL